MLTGLPPFYCRDREKLFEKIRKGHLDYPRTLSARSQNLLRGLLTNDPRRRLGSGPNNEMCKMPSQSLVIANYRYSSPCSLRGDDGYRNL